MVPTVRSLAGTLGSHLRPVESSPLPDDPISAVHISELLDPTAYLSGGELLLTTGLALPAGDELREYVARLLRVRIAALGLGVGPVHPVLPADLVECCRVLGLTLLVVPEPTPFITISRAYWTEVARSGEQELLDQLGAQRALVDAATAGDPASALVRTLARWIGGWAAVLTSDGEIEHAAPDGAAPEVAEITDALRRMERRDGPGALSDVSEGRHIAAFPLGSSDRAGRYLAVGRAGRLDLTVRRTVLAAASLLALTTSRARIADAVTATTGHAIATLLAAGQADAARLLAAESGVPVVGERVHVLALRSGRIDVLARTMVRSQNPLGWSRTPEGAMWFLLPSPVPSTAALEELLRQRDPEVSGTLSPSVLVEEAGEEVRKRLGVLAVLPGGRLDLSPVEPTEARSLLARLDQPVLRDTLEAYLRHRGQWEATAQALGCHRNTVRYRVERVRERLGVDIDDPDVGAHLWLALRGRA